MSRIVTFYSYKGGVGRTFALANIAVLLAKRGKKVLIMDWDLDAPGLHGYFSRYLPKAARKQEGLIHLLSLSRNGKKADWRSFVEEIPIDNVNLSLISSGDRDSHYVELVHEFSWPDFFENHDGGNVLERLRDEWKQAFDFVLVDSRTGITDVGNVCTVLLPDIVVLVFSTNDQSFERGVKVLLGAQEARQKLSVFRPLAAVLPLPGRFDGRDELDEARGWLEKFAEGLKPFYDVWLPADFKPQQILEVTKVPYVAKFSFGEPLPVVTHGITDPELPGFYLDNVAKLLVSDFQEARSLLAHSLENAALVLAEVRSMLVQISIDRVALDKLLQQIENALGESDHLTEILNEAGAAMLRQAQFAAAQKYFDRALQIDEKVSGPMHPSVARDAHGLASALEAMGDLAGARVYYGRALKIIETAYGRDHLTVVTQLNTLGRLLQIMGEQADAQGCYERALKIAETKYGSDHPIAKAQHRNLDMIPKSASSSRRTLIAIFFAALAAAGLTAGVFIYRQQHAATPPLMPSEQQLLNLRGDVLNLSREYNNLPSKPEMKNEVRDKAKNLAQAISRIDDKNLSLRREIFKYDLLCYASTMEAGTYVVAGTPEDSPDESQAANQAIKQCEQAGSKVAEVFQSNSSDQNIAAAQRELLQNDAEPRIDRLKAVGFCIKYRVSHDPLDARTARQLVALLPKHYVYLGKEDPQNTAELRPCMKPGL